MDCDIPGPFDPRIWPFPAGAEEEPVPEPGDDETAALAAAARLDEAIDALEIKIGGMEGHGTCLAPGGSIDVDHDRSALGDWRDLGLTDRMLARAMCPTLFSPTAYEGDVLKEGGTLAEARAGAVLKARRVLADLHAQMADGDRPFGSSLSERLVHDARVVDGMGIEAASRMRLAAVRLDEASLEVRRGREASNALSAVRLDYVPTDVDRLAS